MARGPEKPLEALEALIRAEGSDVVGLQEVQGRSLRSWGRDQTGAVAEELGFDHRWVSTLSRWHGFQDNSGNGLISRTDLQDYRVVELTDAAFEGSPRKAQVARVTVPGSDRHVWVVNLHLASKEGRPARLDQLAALAPALRDLDGPLLLLGDFNARPGSEEHAAILGGALGRPLVDAAAAAGDPAPTFPAGAPTARIDYVFASTDLTILEARVLDPAAALSDHRPLAVTLGLAPPPALALALVPGALPGPGAPAGVSLLGQ